MYQAAGNLNNCHNIHAHILTGISAAESQYQFRLIRTQTA
jgi:hypothetical protein